MGTLKINGIDILTLSTPISSDEIGTKQDIIGSSIKGLKPELDNGTQKLLDAGYKVNGDYLIDRYYDASKSKIRKNGHVITIAYNGTRPRNIKSFSLNMSESVTKYINNIDGILYVADNPRAIGTRVLDDLISTDLESKTCIFNMSMWGAGGRGGGSGYWLFAGNKGGVGGAGGGKIFSHIELENGGCIKIHTNSNPGRTTQAPADTAGNIRAADIFMTAKTLADDNDDAREIAKCTGGLNGRTYKGGTYDNHGDSTGGGGVVSYTTPGMAVTSWMPHDTFYCGIIQYLLKANGGNKNPNYGSGFASTFKEITSFRDYAWEYTYGNQENNQGALVLIGNGGSTGGGQGDGDSGGGSYGNGGNAGTPYSGSAGSNGGGGGGAGARGNGTTGNGGNGGYAGFAIFY